MGVGAYTTSPFETGFCYCLVASGFRVRRRLVSVCIGCKIGDLHSWVVWPKNGACFGVNMGPLCTSSSTLNPDASFRVGGLCWSLLVLFYSTPPLAEARMLVRASFSSGCFKKREDLDADSGI